MIYTNFWLTLITLAFIPIFAKGGGVLMKHSRKYYVAQQAALGALNGYIEENVAGQKVVKVFNHEDVCEEEFGLLNDDLRGKQQKAQFFGGVMGPIMGNTSQITYSLTAGVGGVPLRAGAVRRRRPGDLRQLLAPVLPPDQRALAADEHDLRGAGRRGARVPHHGPRPRGPGRAGRRRSRASGGARRARRRHLRLQSRQDGAQAHLAVRQAGPEDRVRRLTGAGKTTITNLLNRFYDIESGTITIDGIDIRNLKRDTLRRNIAMVLQDTHLFSGTVMENIRYGRLDATDEEVIAAARTASADGFIRRLSDGYNTVIEGDGANLSQGQRQLLNIARAALSKAPILVLDEATSSVDTRTERLIEKGMDRLMENRTTFVIAHRLSTVRNANAIMVLENGEIIERGDHDDLLRQKGRYYELYTGKKELS